MKSLSLENRLPVDVIREVFEYKDGKLFWKRRPLKHFNSTRAQNVFNSKWAGIEAGTLLCPNKEYLISQVSYKGEKHSLLLHIATWAIVNGVYPSQDIDHLDGDGLNNERHGIPTLEYPFESMPWKWVEASKQAKIVTSVSLQHSRKKGVIAQKMWCKFADTENGKLFKAKYV